MEETHTTPMPADTPDSADFDPIADFADFARAQADPLLTDLTDPQRDAVEHAEGPLLILAAAGSGKTRVITRRVAHLVRAGVPPWSILALTFTNKAAGEMRERVTGLLAEIGAARTGGLTITTFHSLCARLLRRYADIANIPGLNPDYTIYDSSDQQALVKRSIANLGLNTSNWAPRAVLSAISNAKNEMMDAEAFAATASDFYARTIATIYKSYQDGLRRANAVDFDDLLLLTVRALQTCEEAREEVQHRWRHVMIDEYQDTNKVQFVLASLIAAQPDNTPPNICVVGDPDQSIYGWRGADIRNILEFEDQYAATRVIALGENFRSTAPILATADTLIRRNKMRKHKDLFTSRDGGELVELTLCADERHEAELVTDWFRARQQDGVEWKEMAVFYRMNALSRVMEDELRRAGFPYVIARGTAFYEREEVKNALSYLRVVANPADDVSLRRILNKPTRGIGATTIARVDTIAYKNQSSLFDALRLIAQGGVEFDLTARAQSAITKFVAMIDAWTGHGAFLGADVSSSLEELTERVITESGLEKHYKSKAEKSGEAPDEDRLANLEEVISSAHEFEQEYSPEDDPAFNNPQTPENSSESPDHNSESTSAELLETPPLLSMLRAYLETVSLVSDADAIDPASGAITLMTLHAAKGLEFDAVAIIGLEDGLLPHSRARESQAELEEERRLCFVGITRAKQRLLMTSARYRTHRGLRERAIPSQFLNELDQTHLIVSDQADHGAGGWEDEDTWAARGRASRGGWENSRSRSRSSRSANSASQEADGWENATGDSGGGAEYGLSVGVRVRHPQFGVGMVEAITMSGANSRARIKFHDVGVKTLVLQYARLDVIN